MLENAFYSKPLEIIKIFVVSISETVSNSESEIDEPSSNSGRFCYIHFRINTLGKGRNPSLPTIYRSNNIADWLLLSCGSN